MDRKKLIPYILLLLLLSGCSEGHAIYSNYREISQLQIIRTVGIDKADEGVGITVSSSRGPQGESPTLISRTGESIISAIQHIQDYTSKEYIFYSHTKNIMIGEEKAKEGIDEILDHILRSPYLRTSIDLYLVKGGDSKEIITGSGSESYDISEVLSSIERDVALHSESWVFNVGQLTRQLTESGAALICAVEAAPPENAIFSEHPELTTKPAGYGVLKDAALIGYISGEEAKGVNLIMDRLYGGSIRLTSSDDISITLIYTDSEAKIEPVWSSDGSLESLDFYITIHSAVSDVDKEAPVTEKKFLEEYRELLSKEAEEWVSHVLDYSIETGADFLELGKKIRSKNPVKFEKLPHGWEKTLKKLNYNVYTQSNIDLSFDINDPVSYDGGGLDNVTTK